jgi:XTP/dITP diphosphohydrolase
VPKFLFDNFVCPLTLETTNAGKQREWNEIIAALRGKGAPQIEIVASKIPLVEIQSLDPVEVAVTKALSAYKKRRDPVLVEDVSFGFDQLKGFPGPLYAPTEKALGLGGILKLADQTNDRRATVKMTIAFGEIGFCNVYLVEATLHGVVPREARGTNGFGFDPIFQPDGYNKTLAEMTAEEKNAMSMRRVAIEKLLNQDWVKHNTGSSVLSSC